MRRYFGLQLRELAALLGISPALATQIEAGRRTLTHEVHARLVPFLDVVEAAPASPPAPDAPPPGSFAAGPLEARRAACLHEVHNLRWHLRTLPEQAATVPLALPPNVLAEWHLAHQRALALEGKATLTTLLAGATT